MPNGVWPDSGTKDKRKTEPILEMILASTVLVSWMWGYSEREKAQTQKQRYGRRGRQRQTLRRRRGRGRKKDDRFQR